LVRRAPEIVRDLIEDYRSALWTPGIGGYLPVHIVLCWNWEYDDSDDDAVNVLQVLIEAYPAGLAHASDADELPLHTALTNTQPPRGVIEILLDHHADVIKQKNHNGCLPLHLAAACEVRPEDETIKLLVDRYSDTVLERNGSGSLPLHLLCANDKVTTGILDTLVNRYTKGLSAFDKNGYLPLHHAIIHNRDGSLVNHMIKPSHWFKGANLPATSDHIDPLFLACEHSASLDVIKILVERSNELFDTYVQQKMQNSNKRQKLA